MAEGRTSCRKSEIHSALQSGLTLIETLLAVAITALVIGLIYSIYHTTLTVVSDQQTRVAGPVAAMSGVNSIARDIACSLRTNEESTDTYSLLASSGPGVRHSEVSFFTGTAKEGESLNWYDIQRVTYRVPDDGPLEGDLIREHQAIVGPGTKQPAVTNVIVSEVTAFHVSFFDGNEWLDTWPPSDEIEIPRAARIAIEVEHKGGRKSFDTEVYIPAGNIVTSSLSRIAAGD